METHAGEHSWLSFFFFPRINQGNLDRAQEYRFPFFFVL